MGTLQEDTDTLQALLITLTTAINNVDPPDNAITSPFNSLSVLFGYVSADPANMVQEEANAFGYLINMTETAANTNGDPDTIAAITAFHAAAAKAFVDHFPELDWDEVVGGGGLRGEGAEENFSGVKHKPEPTA